jgi:hypothetical protein
MSKDKSKKNVAEGMQDFVVYVVAAVSIKVKCRTQDEAAVHGQKEVMRLLSSVDRNVYIPRVAVMTAGDDAEQKENIANEQAPWLSEGNKPS